MNTHTRDLTPRQQELLAKFAVGPDNVARFQSTEIIGDWPEVKKVFVALGAKWKTGKPGGFVFNELDDGGAILAEARASGTILDPKLAGFFETPELLAADLVRRAGIRPGDHVLEPSAGRGRIAKAIVAAQARVTCVELLQANVNELRADPDCFRVLPGDFLLMPGEHSYDAVVMNPPFAKRADIAHIRHAFTFLAPWGKLVSVASSSVLHRDDKLARDFREFIWSRSGLIEPLPEGSFAESGTNVNTCVVTVRKEG